MKKRFIVCGIISVLLIVSFTGCTLAKSDDEWEYSQDIIVTENVGQSLEDYPVPVSLNSSNFDFSKAQNDGSDIRFFSDSKKLKYWIETWESENKEARIWVKIPSLPAKEKDVILMKYGNPEAEDESRGKDTFDFFDDFEDSTFSELRWATESTGGGTIEIENGKCKISAPEAHVHDSSVIYSKNTFDINSMFVVKRIKTTTGTDSRGPILLQGFTDQINSKNNQITHKTKLADESYVSWEVSKKEDYNSPDLTDTSVSEGQWYVSGVAWFKGNENREIAWFKNGVRDSSMDYTSDEAVPNSRMHIYLYTESDSDSSKNTGDMTVEYVYVRKYIEIEPTVFIPTGLESDISKKDISGNNSENNSDNISEINYKKISENISGNSSQAEPVFESENVPESEPGYEGSVQEGIAQAQENENKKETNTSNTSFPEYHVTVSGIKLSSPYQFDIQTLSQELNSSGINTIFLSVGSENVWQYERFVKKAHEKGIAVHAVILEDSNFSEDTDLQNFQESLNSVFDYNNKSLAPFDGINIYVKSSVKEESGNNYTDYRTLFETAYEKARGNVSVSASIPSQYPVTNIDEIAPLVNFFMIRAYDKETEKLNSESSIVDSIAPQMGEIRGMGSKGLIEVSVGEGFENKVSIQKLIKNLANYYSNDSAFLGVSISNYETYTALPQASQPEDDGFQVHGFRMTSALLASLGVFAALKAKRK